MSPSESLTVAVAVWIVFSIGFRSAIIGRVWNKASEQIHDYNLRAVKRGSLDYIDYPSDAVFSTFPKFLLACIDLRKWTRRQLFPYAVAAFTQDNQS